MRVSPDRGVIVELTEREAEVISGYADGLPTKTIAHCLHISEKTVEYHRAKIYMRLKINNLVHLTKWAIRAGLSGLSCIALTSAAAQTAVPLKFVWNNPLVTDPGASNLTYRLYSTTNLSLPTNQWLVINIVQPFTNTPITLCTTQNFVYDNYFFYMTWTNAMWKKESPFSNQAVPDRLPSNFLNFSLGILPTP